MRKRLGQVIIFATLASVIALIALGIARIDAISGSEPGAGRLTPRPEAEAREPSESPQATVPADVRSSSTSTPSPTSKSPSRSVRADQGIDLVVVDPRTGVTTLLLSAPGTQGEGDPSPDGTQVAYGSKSQIFVLEADGSRRQLTNMPDRAVGPTWSPDGSRIAFSSGGSDQDIFVINADGSGLHRVVDTPKQDESPDWSPDGSRIVFASGKAIWTVSVDDGALSRLTRPAWPDRTPVWSPNGEWIAFIRLDDGEYLGKDSDVWLMRPDGTHLHRILHRERRHHEDGDGTPDGNVQGALAWSPGGDSIARLKAESPSSPQCTCITFLHVETGRQDEVPIHFWLYDMAWSSNGMVVASADSSSIG